MNRYLSIYEDIRDKIINGIYSPGTKLPSKRVTAESFGVSIITVEHAYELLIEEGYIQAKERSGYFVIFDEVRPKEVNKENRQINKVARIHTEEKDNFTENTDIETFPSSAFSKIARKVITNYADDIMRKTPNYGSEELRMAISSYLARYRGIYAGTDQIIIGSGAEYLYGLIVQALGRDSIYGIESPSYQKIAQIYEAEGIKYENLPLGADGIKSEELWKSDARVLHITPYRSYPTGVTATAAKKREYLRWCEENNSIIIEDDFESEFSPSRKTEETLYAIDNQDRVIYVNTFTRTIGGAMRMAYMVIPEKMVDTFNEKIGFYTCTVPTFDQLIVKELIDSGDFERHINRMRRKIRKRGKL